MQRYDKGHFTRRTAMKKKSTHRIILLSFMLCGSLAWEQSFAVSSLYCPQNHKFISLGMSQVDVIAGCGQPLAIQKLNRYVTQQVPVKQLFYNNKGSPTAFYGVWNLPTGVNTGAQLEIDIINDKVANVRLNTNDVNATSLCGKSIQVGATLAQVYSSCGQPTVMNQTFINQPIPSLTPPEVWIYKPNPFQNTTIRLTFADGKLHSIDGGDVQSP